MPEKYCDLSFDKPVLQINPSDLLVKTQVALKQLVAEKPPVTPPPVFPVGDPVTPSDGGQEETPPEPKVEPINKHFYMSAKLDNVRINRDVNTYVQEIIQHLSAVSSATVELKLEVEVNAPEGIPNNVVRTVSENCRTLRVTDFGFDN